jgi:hypothetical protein
MSTLADPEMPLRLADAAKYFGVKTALLRTEIHKNRLAVFLVAGKYFTTLAAVQRMF